MKMYTVFSNIMYKGQTLMKTHKLESIRWRQSKSLQCILFTTNSLVSLCSDQCYQTLH